MKSLKPMRSMLVMLALAAGSVAATSPALALVALSPQVTGHITAIPSSTTIVIDGKQYLVKVDSAAFNQLSSLQVGEIVGLVMDGPASSSSSHVIAIQVNAPPANAQPAGAH
jgi:hypothetical protein